MADACRRRFDAILVWKIDRFGRSLKHLVNSVANLAALGAGFVSLRDNFDLSTPSGRLMFQIIGAMAGGGRSRLRLQLRRQPDLEDQLPDGITENCGYGQIYQLRQVTQGGSTTESYTYDAVGNRLSSSGMPSCSYNASNQLTSNYNGSFTYDAKRQYLPDPCGKSIPGTSRTG